MPFSFTNTLTKRNTLLHILSATYSLCNMALYFESPNEFPEHYGLSHHRLSEFSVDDDRRITLPAFILTFCLTSILGYSIKKSYMGHINKILPKPNNPDERNPLISTTETIEPKHPRFDLIMAGISGFYKASVASAALLTLLKNKTGAKAAWSISSLCFLGNFFAQFSILAASLLKKCNLHIPHDTTRWVVTHLLTFSYNLPNAALYFNAADGFFRKINWNDGHRFSDDPNDWDYAALGLLTISSVFLFISTQRSYSKKIANIFTKHKDTAISHQETVCYLYSKDTVWNKAYNALAPYFAFESRYTTVYKAAINYISLVITLYSLSQNVPLSLALAGFCIPGNLYAQYSILKIEPSKQQLSNELIEPKVSIPIRYGLFSKRVVKNTLDLNESQNPTHEMQAVQKTRPQGAEFFN